MRFVAVEVTGVHMAGGLLTCKHDEGVASFENPKRET